MKTNSKSDSAVLNKFWLQSLKTNVSINFLDFSGMKCNVTISSKQTPAEDDIAPARTEKLAQDWIPANCGE